MTHKRDDYRCDEYKPVWDTKCVKGLLEKAIEEYNKVYPRIRLSLYDYTIQQICRLGEEYDGVSLLEKFDKLKMEVAGRLSYQHEKIDALYCSREGNVFILAMVWRSNVAYSSSSFRNNIEPCFL